MPQTAEQLQAARALAAEYGLTGADFYQHRQSQSFLISRTGIEKIQYKAGIEVGFDAEKIELDFAAVKATASRKVKVGEAKTATKLTIQTFGSASKSNCQVSYYLEMAEKRALSRAVLKLTDFYQLGVYGEDEMPPVSFRAEEPQGQPTAAPTPVMRAVASAPASAQTEVQYATASQKEYIIRLLEHPLITSEEKRKMLLNIQRLDEERAAVAITKLEQAIADREEQALATGNEHVLTEGNEPAGETPAAQPSGAPAPSTTFDQSSDAEAARIEKVSAGFAKASEEFDAHVAKHRAAEAATTTSDQSSADPLAEQRARFDGFTSKLELEAFWKTLTGGEQKQLVEARTTATARINDAVALAARTMVRQQPTVGIKDAGADASLVAEFCEQPTVANVEFVAATDEQRQMITRLLDHPLITRREKTALLLKINKLDKERARQCIIKLREAIEDRENGNTAGALREHLHKQLNEYGGLLGEEIVADYAQLVEDGEASVERLRAALDEVRNVLSVNQDAEQETEVETAIAA